MRGISALRLPSQERNVVDYDLGDCINLIESDFFAKLNGEHMT